jgi:hypothetical protein
MMPFKQKLWIEIDFLLTFPEFDFIREQIKNRFRNKEKENASKQNFRKHTLSHVSRFA